MKKVPKKKTRKLSEDDLRNYAEYLSECMSFNDLSEYYIEMALINLKSIDEKVILKEMKDINYTP